MNRLIKHLFFCSLLMGGQVCLAQEEKEGDGQSFEEQIAKVVQLGAGVHHIEKNKKGHIISCVVVGQARISTALGKAKGMELAHDKANLACSAEFVKWLKEEASLYQSNEDDTIFLLEGSEGDEDDVQAESPQSIERSSKKMETLSKGLVRGLRMLHRDVDGEGKTLTIVKGWKADTAEGTKKVASDLASDEPADEKTLKDSKSLGKKGKTGLGKEIESSSVTSEDAAEFFPKRKMKK